MVGASSNQPDTNRGFHKTLNLQVGVYHCPFQDSDASHCLDVPTRLAAPTKSAHSAVSLPTRVPTRLHDQVCVWSPSPLTTLSRSSREQPHATPPRPPANDSDVTTFLFPPPASKPVSHAKRVEIRRALRTRAQNSCPPWSRSRPLTPWRYYRTARPRQPRSTVYHD